MPENEWRIVIVDHLSLLSTDPHHNNKYEALGQFSAEYMINLRNFYQYTIVAVQQQAQATEGIENFKLSRLQPSVDGLGNNKEIARDYDLLLGLFTPYRYKIHDYNGYNIKALGDRYRELLVIANRDGESVSTNLYFDGAVNFFKELPNSNSSELDNLYERIRNEA